MLAIDRVTSKPWIDSEWLIEDIFPLQHWLCTVWNLQHSTIVGIHCWLSLYFTWKPSLLTLAPIPTRHYFSFLLLHTQPCVRPRLVNGLHLYCSFIQSAAQFPSCFLASVSCSRTLVWTGETGLEPRCSTGWAAVLQGSDVKLALAVSLKWSQLWQCQNWPGCPVSCAICTLPCDVSKTQRKSVMEFSNS